MGQKTILIVEDDEAIRETLALALEYKGYRLFEATNGQEGIEMLARIPTPCLILLDLMMPVMDGWGFVEATQKDPRMAAIPVVIVTAFNLNERQIKAKEVVRKPLSLDELFAAVGRYCR